MLGSSCRRTLAGMPSIKDAAAEFLTHQRVAVTGVSREPKDHGANVVYKRLRERGYEVFAVNPNADEVECDRCYHDLRAIPSGVETVVIATRPQVAEETMRECAELGIRHVWMHRRAGGRKRLRGGSRLRPRARHRRDRRRLPVHVRAHGRSRPQGDAHRPHDERQRAADGLRAGPLSS
jgi:predicted CoA-binding protein